MKPINMTVFLFACESVFFTICAAKFKGSMHQSMRNATAHSASSSRNVLAARNGAPGIEPCMKIALICTCLVIALTACTPDRRSPDAIREDTAKATSEVVKDAKAMGQGVAEGLKQGGTVNVNTASADDLEKLPGIEEHAAKRIIDGRPYDDAHDMVKKHVISQAEYDKIAGKITAK
jgi:hypothetical protein